MYLVVIETSNEVFAKLAEAIKALVDLADDFAKQVAEIVKKAVEAIEDNEDKYDIVDNIAANSTQIGIHTVVRRPIPP